MEHVIEIELTSEIVPPRFDSEVRAH